MIDTDTEAGQVALANEALSAKTEEDLHAETPPSAPEAAPAAPGAPQSPAVATDHVSISVLQDYQQRLARYEQQEQQRQQAAQQAQQKPAEPPDPFMAPDKFADWRIQQQMAPVLERMQQQQEQLRTISANNNLATARAIHGQELADAAYQAFDKALPQMSPYEQAQVLQAQNPFVAAVQWHQRTQILQEVGDNPAGYRERILEEALRDPDYLARAREAYSAQIAGRQAPLPPRNEAGQFTPAPPAKKQLPSVNRAGSAQQAMSAAPVALDDEDLVAEIMKMDREP